MSREVFDKTENVERERAYQKLCEFERNYCEHIYEDSNGSVVYEIDKTRLAELENIDEDILRGLDFSTVEYPSYQKLFEARYRNRFLRNVAAISPNELEKKLGRDTLENATQRDKDLRLKYAESIKEIDLDNDGVPDRIDIDDTRNSVQTVADLSIVKNSTDKETSRDRDKGRARQQDDLEL